MMQIVRFRKKVCKAIGGASFIFVFSISAVLSKNTTFEIIQDYFGDIRTLQANFSQTDHMGDIRTGDLFLKKPGKIRFSYDPPNNLQIVSKQQAVLIFDPQNSGSGPLTFPLSSTPLGFLINNDWSSQANEDGEVIELEDMMFLKVQNPRYQLTIKFNTNPISIIGWEFKNQMGETIRITLTNIQKNNYISDEIFKTEKDYELFKK